MSQLTQVIPSGSDVGSEREPTTTFSPSATRRLAIASPIPLDPPVTKAVLVMVSSPFEFQV